MKKTTSFAFTLLVALLMNCGITIAQNHKAGDLTGIWYNEEMTSKLQIYQEGTRFFAKIIWLKDPNDPGTGKPRTDNLNPEPTLQKATLMGLVVLKDFRFDGSSEWNGGTIYDPKNGKTYSCKIHFGDSPNLLKIRGYIGVSLIGRTTYWTKTK